MPTLDDLAQMNEETIQDAIQRARLARNEDVKTRILIQAIEQVRDKLSEVTVSNMSDKITVRNLDEVRLSLRKELGRAMKPLLTQFAGLNLNKAQIQKIQDEADTMVARSFDDNFDTLIIKKPKQRFSVDNLGDIQFPPDMSINNLGELQTFFDSLQTTIRDTFNIDIPVPQVNVSPPEVNVAPAPVNIPQVDLSPLLGALKPLKFISDNPNKPISVRMSNGRKFVDLLNDILAGQAQQVQAFTGSQGATKKDISRILGVPGTMVSGTKAMTGSAVQLTSTNVKIRWMDVTAINSPCAIGDSTVVADLSTASNSIGVVVGPLLPYRVEVNNANKVYADGPAGSAVSFSYFA